jgi:hypothetical protein
MAACGTRVAGRRVSPCATRSRSGSGGTVPGFCKTGSLRAREPAACFWGRGQCPRRQASCRTGRRFGGGSRPLRRKSAASRGSTSARRADATRAALPVVDVPVSDAQFLNLQEHPIGPAQFLHAAKKIGFQFLEKQGRRVWGGLPVFRERVGFTSPAVQQKLRPRRLGKMAVSEVDHAHHVQKRASGEQVEPVEFEILAGSEGTGNVKTSRGPRMNRHDKFIETPGPVAKSDPSPSGSIRSRRTPVSTPANTCCITRGVPQTEGTGHWTGCPASSDH